MGKEWETIFLGSRITADSDCSHEIKRCLLLGRKSMTNLDSTIKSRDITLSTKVHLVKAMVFPVVMYRCESWTIKKAEHRRTDAFELRCWRRLLRVPWRANQTILREISPEYSLERLMLKLKLQYFGHLMRRTNSLEKSLTLGKTEGRRRRGLQKMKWLDGITDNRHEFEQAPGVGDGQGSLVCCSPWGSQRVGYNWAIELNWLCSKWHNPPPRHHLYGIFSKIGIFYFEVEKRTQYERLGLTVATSEELWRSGERGIRVTTSSIIAHRVTDARRWVSCSLHSLDFTWVIVLQTGR